MTVSREIGTYKKSNKAIKKNRSYALQREPFKRMYVHVHRTKSQRKHTTSCVFLLDPSGFYLAAIGGKYDLYNIIFRSS